MSEETVKSRLTTTVLVFGRSRGGAAAKGKASSVSSLHDGESVDSSGLPRGDGGGGGGAGGGGGGDKDGDDDSTVSSLNSTDQALMGDLRKGLGEAVNAEAATGAGGTDKQYFDALLNQGRASLEDDDGDGSSPDGLEQCTERGVGSGRGRGGGSSDAGPGRVRLRHRLLCDGRDKSPEGRRWAW